jgi:hypothetical protein
VIIVSESSAEVTLRVRMEGRAPVRSRGSPAHNNTLRYKDSRRISVHTEVLAGILSPQTSPGSSYDGCSCFPVPRLCWRTCLAFGAVQAVVSCAAELPFRRVPQ